MEKTTFTIIYRVKDFDKTEDFYQNLLEFETEHSWNNGPGKRGHVFYAGNGQIEILEFDGLEEEYPQPRNFEIAITVEPIDEFYKLIQEKGVDIYKELSLKPWGQRTFSVLDPNGAKLIFGSNM